jgi:hypothetical protein
LPDGHAIALIRELATRQPSCAVVVVSVFGDEDTVIACVASLMSGRHRCRRARHPRSCCRRANRKCSN